MNEFIQNEVCKVLTKYGVKDLYNADTEILSVFEIGVKDLRLELREANDTIKSLENMMYKAHKEHQEAEQLLAKIYDKASFLVNWFEPQNLKEDVIVEELEKLLKEIKNG